MDTNNTIINTILFHFPNIPKSVFRFSRDDLTIKEKYLEIKMYMKHFNGGDNYWQYSQEISNFLVNLYYNNVITMDELFTEVFIDRDFCNLYRFLEHCNCKSIYFRRKSILEYIDFRMELISRLNDHIKNDESFKTDRKLSGIYTNSYNLGRLLNIYDDNDKSGLIERYEERLTELLIQIIYHSFYDDELDLCSELVIPMKAYYSENILEDKVKLVLRSISSEEKYMSVLMNYEVEDFMILYLFFESYESEDNSNVEKFKQILQKVYEKRGIKYER